MEEKHKELFSEENIKELLAQIEQIEKDEITGKLIRLKAPVGATVFYVHDGFIRPCVIRYIKYAGKFITYCAVDGNDLFEFRGASFGRDVFLLYEDAEKRLKEICNSTP